MVMLWKWIVKRDIGFDKLISLFLGRKSILQSYVKDDADMNDIELQSVYVIDTAIDLDLFCMVGITNCTIR